ncbi:hypothetical protein HELRODRAFT_193897 [Helobdella robusta]|uniref:Cytoplasmic dynein 2 light intermediate chain 1 n=1 Tax=Helobdella robusta TaxID=6412 RepID=T1FVG5_HELRO|nr:hypothetical protein HELRODRAFT_193897 [Helobdella robusta]ESN93853.1 hypothetical protein HELRODRAFT_193897 [Helobdella robusta]
MNSKEKNMTKNEHEKSVVFLGGKSSGKTSIILRFLERPDDQAKPTVGVEYVYARMNKSNSMGKDIGHVWEVGGGVLMSKLIESVIDNKNISSTGIVLTVDLSQPKRLWTVLEHWLRVLKSRVDDVIKHGDDGKNGRIRERLLEAARMKYKEDHPDLDLLDLFPLPITIVCTKYDTFQNFESEERKVICRTLRFLAHTIGAHLQFCSTMKCEGLVSRVKGLISNLLFNTEIAPSQQTAHNKPLSVTAGQDTMQDIGMPPIPDGDVGKLSARTPMELWKYAYTKYFPQEDIMISSSSSSSVKDPSKDIQYKEVEIDALKMQKDQELMKYMKTLERQDELRSL